MTLRQKISWQIGGMLVALLLLSGAAFWGINAQRQDYSVALEGYQRLRQAYVAGTHLSTAQKLLLWQHPLAMSAAITEVRAAVTDLDLQAPPAVDTTTLPVANPEDTERTRRIRSALQAIASRLEAAEDAPTRHAIEAERDAIVGQLGQIAEMSAGIRRATEAAQQAADAKRQATIAILGGLCAAVMLAGVALGFLHYRGVMLPIRRLTEGVHRLTAGQFKGRVHVRGKDELASLARDFNRMADELNGFYNELEKKVADKSRELVRSERLASVGYLAAGVAHEINNPLSIMLGYAEYALAELKATPSSAMPLPASTSASQSLPTDEPEPEPSDHSEIAKSLKIICDEAFRCKAITQKLLSLARGGDEPRQPVSLLAVANEVAYIVGGLKEHREKRLVVRADWSEQSEEQTSPSTKGAELFVLAVEAEMKQVVLNLAVNALEAVEPGIGEVRLDLRVVQGGQVELTVADNGRGMSPQTLERVFEPFFTDHRGTREDGKVGTGLGLSITHAIVRDHGGTISAFSDGLGKGSRFVIRLDRALTQ